MNIINDLEISLLGFLIDCPLHGYDLFRRVSDLEGFGVVWHLKIGKLYAMLSKLNDAKLVSVHQRQEGNRPVRKEFEISEKGNDLFSNWLTQPVIHGRDLRTIFLLKVLFLINHDKSKLSSLLEKQKEECNLWKGSLEKFSIEKQPSQARIGELRFKEFVYQYRKNQIEANIQWLVWMLENLTEDQCIKI